MTSYRYRAMNAAGQEVESDIEAGTVEDAINRIRAQGLYPTKVLERALKHPAAKRSRRIALSQISIGCISRRRIAECTDQLSILQNAGLPILRSLQVLAQQERPGPFRTILAQVAEGVEGGATLSESMARHPRAFDKLYVSMVHAGEAGGVLDVILQRLAEFMDKAQRLRRRIIGAMIYPTAVISFAVLIVTGIMMFVVPKFQEIFRDFGAKLPSLTLWLMRVSTFIARDYGWLAILGAPFALWLTLKLTAKSDAGRFLLDRAKLRIPIVGNIVAKTAISRFSRTLGTLLAAGVPILDALKITHDTVGNGVYQRALRKVHDAIREGETFAAPLRASRVCDPLVINMIDVGEQTGDLDQMLVKIADTYDDKVDVLVGSLVSLLEPVLVIVLGGIVGTIVVALFLPLVELLRSMNGG